MGARRRLQHDKPMSKKFFIFCMFIAGFATYGATWLMLPIVLLVLYIQESR